MTTRPFQLPQDVDLMNALIIDGFKYPENPEWSIQEDEVQSMIDQMKGAKKIWPVLWIMRIFVPLFRDILCGFIEEEDGKPVGLINYMRQRKAPEWLIANVTVLPAYRRRGIARRLVAATLNELRRRNAKVAFLDVVVGNDPAFNLYQEMGFEAFKQFSEYDFQKDTPVAPIPLPVGYTLKPLSRFDWKTRFAFAQRVTPEYIQRYEPATEDRYQVPKLMPLFGKLFESAGGAHSERFAIYAPNGDVVGVGQYTYRTRAGGKNFAGLSIDPNRPQLAEFILRYVFSTIQKASPGHRMQLNFEDWESALIECAEELGCEKRLSSHRMGLRF